ncbi:MAG: aminotransferase class IV, partial [Chitinophagales bacterium]|nr:aminotransferase class IV [Chitinophagales bacterium]
EEPFRIGIFEEVKKDSSTISYFKSMNALPYILASIYKSENNLNDCLLLNSKGMVAEATSSNIFWIKAGEIFSPPVSDGGVEGVMRKNLIMFLKENNFPFKEKSVSPAELKTADEVFLTNVGWGIKQVTEFENVFYQTKITAEIFKMIQQ